MKWEDASEVFHHMPDSCVLDLQTVYRGHWINVSRLGGKRVRLSVAKGPASEYIATNHDNIYEILLYLGFEHSPMMSVLDMDWHLYLDGHALDSGTRFRISSMESLSG